MPVKPIPPLPLERRLSEIPRATLRPTRSRRQRRRARLIRFTVLEAIALAALFLTAQLTTSRSLLDASYNRLCELLLFGCAALVAAVPIVFFGPPKRW